MGPNPCNYRPINVVEMPSKFVGSGSGAPRRSQPPLSLIIREVRCRSCLEWHRSRNARHMPSETGRGLDVGHTMRGPGVGHSW